MSETGGDLDLRSLDDEELTKQIGDDLYDGLKDEVVEGVHILLERGWTPYRVLTEALVAGMTIVGIARALNKDEKPFFRAMDRLHAAIGAGLLAEGIRPEDVHELIESGALGDLIDDEPQGGRGAAAFTEGARTPWRKR